MQVADLNIIPSRPSLFDLWASARTCASLKEIGGEFVFLLNQCPPAHETARVRDGVETLEEMGGLISPLILSRVDYQEAARHGGASLSSTRTARRQRKCGAFGSPSSAVWRAAKSGPPARRHELEASLVRLVLTQSRAAFLPPLAQIGRTLPKRPAFFLIPAQPPSRVRIVSPPR
jgi:chromosome partitioning protein